MKYLILCTFIIVIIPLSVDNLMGNQYMIKKRKKELTLCLIIQNNKNISKVKEIVKAVIDTINGNKKINRHVLVDSISFYRCDLNKYQVFPINKIVYEDKIFTAQENKSNKCKTTSFEDCYDCCMKKFNYINKPYNIFLFSNNLEDADFNNTNEIFHDSSKLKKGITTLIQNNIILKQNSNIVVFPFFKGPIIDTDTLAPEFYSYNKYFWKGLSGKGGGGYFLDISNLYLNKISNYTLTLDYYKMIFDTVGKQIFLDYNVLTSFYAKHYPDDSLGFTTHPFDFQLIYTVCCDGVSTTKLSSPKRKVLLTCDEK